jgi:hypothetical protein
MALRIKTIRLDHESCSADEQVTKAGAGSYARVAVVSSVGSGEESAFLGLSSQEHAVMRDEHVLKNHDYGRLPIFPESLAADSPGRPAGRADGDARGVHPHGAADGKIRVLAGMGPAGHRQEFVYVWGQWPWRPGSRSRRADAA